jgi:hypothetical protein
MGLVERVHGGGAGSFYSDHVFAAAARRREVKKERRDEKRTGRARRQSRRASFAACSPVAMLDAVLIGVNGSPGVVTKHVPRVVKTSTILSNTA